MEGILTGRGGALMRYMSPPKNLANRESSSRQRYTNNTSRINRSISNNTDLQARKRTKGEARTWKASSKCSQGRGSQPGQAARTALSLYAPGLPCINYCNRNESPRIRENRHDKVCIRK